LHQSGTFLPVPAGFEDDSLCAGVVCPLTWIGCGALLRAGFSIPAGEACWPVFLHVLLALAGSVKIILMCGIHWGRGVLWACCVNRRSSQKCWIYSQKLVGTWRRLKSDQGQDHCVKSPPQWGVGLRSPSSQPIKAKNVEGLSCSGQQSCFILQRFFHSLTQIRFSYWFLALWSVYLRNSEISYVLAHALPAALRVNLIIGFLLLVLTCKAERKHLDSG